MYCQCIIEEVKKDVFKVNLVLTDDVIGFGCFPKGVMVIASCRQIIHASIFTRDRPKLHLLRKNTLTSSCFV